MSDNTKASKSPIHAQFQLGDPHARFTGCDPEFDDISEQLNREFGSYLNHRFDE